MTRFTRTLTAALLVALCAPVQAAECPIPTIYPSLNADGSCLSLRCHGLRLLREAYQRGEISTVHLSTRSECSALSTYDVATGETVAVPCTWDHNDDYRPF